MVMTTGGLTVVIVDKENVASLVTRLVTVPLVVVGGSVVLLVSLDRLVLPPESELVTLPELELLLPLVELRLVTLPESLRVALPDEEEEGEVVVVMVVMPDVVVDVDVMVVGGSVV